jgi:hypothetical protein
MPRTVRGRDRRNGAGDPAQRIAGAHRSFDGTVRGRAGNLPMDRDTRDGQA